MHHSKFNCVELLLMDAYSVTSLESFVFLTSSKALQLSEHDMPFCSYFIKLVRFEYY